MDFLVSISWLIFISSRFNSSARYSSCSLWVNFLLRWYWGNRIPGFCWFSNAPSPPDKCCHFHYLFLFLLLVFDDSPAKYRFAILIFSSPFYSFSHHTTKDRRHVFVSPIFPSLQHFSRMFFCFPFKLKTALSQIKSMWWSKKGTWCSAVAL